MPGPILESFEGGTTDNVYDSTVGDGWTVTAINRTSGFAQPVYRPLPDPLYLTPAPATPGEGMGLGFVGSSAWALGISYSSCAGLGGYFFSDSNGAGGWSAMAMDVLISFNNVAAAGSVAVSRYGHDLEIRELYDDLETVVDQTTTVTLTDFVDTGGFEPSGAWLEISFHESSGWNVRNGRTGSLIAHGDYPWSIPPGAAWSLNYRPNADGPSGPSGSVRGAVDNLYGWPGSAAAAAVRLFPRDDGRGMSSAPRIHPAPRSGRVIGGHQ